MRSLLFMLVFTVHGMVMVMAEVGRCALADGADGLHARTSIWLLQLGIEKQVCMWAGPHGWLWIFAVDAELR